MLINISLPIIEILVAEYAIRLFASILNYNYFMFKLKLYFKHTIYS